jgi:hypothetical protein
MGAAERGLANMWLERGQRRPVEQHRLDAPGFQLLDVPVNGFFAAGAAPDLDPAGRAQERAGTGGFREPQVLGARCAHQRGHRLGGLALACRGRCRKVAPELGRDRGQRLVADMGAGIAVERCARDITGASRKEVRQDRLALDNAGIAEARLARCFAQAIDDGDASTARLKGERRGDADNPGAEHDHIDGLRHLRLALIEAPGGRLDSRRAFL